MKVSNTATPAGASSEAAALTVLAEDGHKVFLSFSEGGLSVTNLGNLAGNGVFAVRDGFPAASAKVPAGAFAPTDNSSALDFGGIAAGQGGRAVDLTNRIDNTLGPMTAFTVSGWLNCSDLTEGWGGNRIAFALASPGGPGFDLVQLANGALRLGVNQWPDAGAGGPLSSEGKVTADPATGAANWVFFAVTYDSTLEFGKRHPIATSAARTRRPKPISPRITCRAPSSRAGPSPSATSATWPEPATRRVPGGGSRCFRGLIDEVNVFNKVLTLAEIQATQKAPAYKPAVVDPVVIPAAEPASQTVFAGTGVTFRLNATGTPPLSYQWWKRHAGTDSAITGATGSSHTLATTSTGDSGDEIRPVVENAKNSVTSRKAVLTVLTEDNHKVSLSFSEAGGATTANLGNIGGQPR